MTHKTTPNPLAVFALLLLLVDAASAQTDEAITQPTRVAQGSFETADFVHVVNEVHRLSEKHAPNEVLLVLDVDNTLLAMDQDLGSDQWFGWQRDLQKTTPNSPDLVADDFDGLLEAQGVLFALSRMHPPEPQLPTRVRQIQKLGVKVIVLTSRGPEFSNATERELSRNGYDFSARSLSIIERRGPFNPVDVTKPEQHGLSASEAEQLRSRLRSVSYASGVFMVAGQHKGYMLRALLSRVQHDSTAGGYLPKAIVFVDDRQRHVNDVLQAFGGMKLDLVAVRYTREDGNVERFLRAKKRRVSHDWNTLEKAIEVSLPRQQEATEE